MTREISIEPSSIETIDAAILDWLNNIMDIHANTNRGWKKTPVIWVGAERAHQIKSDRVLRDVNGNFILPAIAIQRDSITKSLTHKGAMYAAVPGDDNRGGTMTVSKRISQEKTSKYAQNKNFRKHMQYNVKEKNDKVVYEITKTPIPVYIDVKYTITVNTEYQQQMNEIIQPFMTYTRGINHFVLKKENHVYEAFFEKDSIFKNDGTFKKLEDNARVFTTDFTISVLGYLLGSGVNEDRPKIVISETIVEVKLPREREILGESELTDKKIF